MITSKNMDEPRAAALHFRNGKLCLELVDGREYRVLLAFYPTLSSATAKQRNNWRQIGMGVGFHWPDLDLSVEGVLAGVKEQFPPPPPMRSVSVSYEHRVEKTAHGWAVILQTHTPSDVFSTKQQAQDAAKRRNRGRTAGIRGARQLRNPIPSHKKAMK